MKKQKLQSGFTLIELLVVIAIIGILASVVLASLNTARNKGIDAAIKASLANSRAQAELFYDNHTNSYANVCQSTAVDDIGEMVLSAAQKIGNTSINGNGTAFAYSASGGIGSAVCHDTATGWAAIVSLKNPTTASSGWCVDSTGISREATQLTDTSVVCGS